MVQMPRITVPLVASVIVVIALVPVAWTADPRIEPPADLHAVWDEMMLSGTFGWIHDGKPQKSGYSQNSGRGWIHEVSLSSVGIDVMALRERHFLKSPGGWVLKGGRLGRVAVGNEEIELYGKTIERNEPYVQPWIHVQIGGEHWALAHEFSLLRRATPVARATLIRRWIVSDVRGESGPLVLRGLVEHREAQAQIVVQVLEGFYAGIFVERIGLSGSPAPVGGPSAGELTPAVTVGCPPSGGSRAESPVDPAERSWETMMLAGNFGWVRDGRRLSTSAHVPFAAADGWVNQVRQTTGAISVSSKDNLDGPVQGGLLRRVVSGSQAIELYAKQLRLSGRDFNRLVVWGGWGPAHEFFLVVRARDKQPLVVRRWKIPFEGPGRFFLRGFLEYDAAMSLASVRVIDGLDSTAIDDRVSLRACW